MEKYTIYKDIEKRTGGDVYIGVVGPVRTGKSTFVSKFMELAVLPNIAQKNKKAVATDEMPQSGAGKTVTTTEPKFVPSEAVTVKVAGGGRARVRLIDCVGYMVNGAMGHEEDGKPRMVKTPWSDQPMTFEQAAETGTEKVICLHSTVGVVITTDGSFTGIDRKEYESAEERVIDQLSKLKKPFVIVLNVKDEKSERALELANKLSQKYGTGVIVKNVTRLTEEDIDEILSSLLLEFPVRVMGVRIPEWMRTLSADNELIAPLLSKIKDCLPKVKRMKDAKVFEDALLGLDYLSGVTLNLNLGDGSVKIDLTPKEEVFYEQLSKVCGEQLSDEFSLMRFVRSAATAKREYEKLRGALEEAEQTGYGIVAPSEDQITLSQPEMVKNGNVYGVKIKATAPSLHIVKVEIGAEVNSVVGKEKQCSDYVTGLVKQYEQNPQGIMRVDLFGRPIYSFVSEEIYDKAGGMKAPFRDKLCKTVSKLVNEKKNALFCVTI